MINNTLRNITGDIINYAAKELAFSFQLSEKMQHSDWNKIQQQEYIQLGINTLQRNQLLFSNTKNEMIQPGQVQKWMYSVQTKYTLKHVSPHGLRHTHCSLLFEAGATIKELQDRPGHSDVKTKVERQGLYYRLAAEQLGMIERVGPNHSQINYSGKEFLALTTDEQKQVYLSNAVLHNPACHSVYSFIYNNPNCDRIAITNHLINEGLSDSLANRRGATIINWLNQLKLIKDTNNTYRVLWRPAFNDNVQVIENLSVTNEEVTNHPENDLSTVEDIWDGSYTRNDEEISFNVDRTSRERASISHQNLVRTMAQKLNHKHITPMMNKHIDLYASINNQMHIFEMKSCNQDNIISQIRKGFSQLYEYRYRYNFNGAKLWLVLEEPPINNNSWSIDYLVIDRRINICWLSENSEFDCPELCLDELNELLE